MVVGIDLRPLTPEIIESMGYDMHDLWMVKIDATVYGPFETESLKHYVLENEALFEHAEASRADEKEWKPFWAYTKFQRRKPQAVSENHEGPFWLMDAGLKVGPFTYQEIDKKLEMDLLGMTDHISVDNGESWKKIYEISGFDRRSHSPDELPIAPPEYSFQQARLEVINKLETPHFNPQDELAELAWQSQQQLAKVIPFKAEDVAIKHPSTVTISDSMKWAAPIAAMAVIGIVTSGFMMLNSPEGIEIADSTPEETTEKPFYQKPKARAVTSAPPATMPGSSIREPASVRPSRPAPVVHRTSSIPTFTETHDQFQEPQDHFDEPMDEPVLDAEQRTEEHSLVSNNQTTGTAEENNLDAVMNGTPDQPVIDEASDF